MLGSWDRLHQDVRQHHGGSFDEAGRVVQSLENVVRCVLNDHDERMFIGDGIDAHDEGHEAVADTPFDDLAKVEVGR